MISILRETLPLIFADNTRSVLAETPDALVPIKLVRLSRAAKSLTFLGNLQLDTVV